MRVSAPIEGPPRASPREVAGAAPERGRGYLTRTGRSALEALAEVAIREPAVPPEEVAANVDRYMTTFLARRKWVVKAALLGLWALPLASLKPPFPAMRPERRREFIESRFQREIPAEDRAFLRRMTRAMIRLSLQMVYLGYYGDERSFARTGYAPFSRRADYEERTRGLPRERRPLRMHDADGRDEIAADAVVVGSGAAGAILAYRLAEAGREVVVLERGRHVDPSEFTEDEVTQISTLYADGALQLTRDFSFQVLQGMCVGGSTVVNNAVCFDLPDPVLERWNGPEHDARLDPAALRRAHDEVRDWLRIRRPPSPHLHPGAEKFMQGVERLGLAAPPGDADVVATNIADCPGSGYCNIGCPFGTKLSMLDLVLPEGQERFGDRLRILPECRVERIEHSNGRAEAVVAKRGDGRTLRVRARTVVVAAGTVASSWILMQSKIAKGVAGTGLSFNMGSPITADFEERLDAYDGVQISHYLNPGGEQGWVMETWFNPVVSQALNMPGWFDEHERNMDRYCHLTAGGVLVGTRSDGVLKPALTGGADIVYSPHPDDVRTLVGALKQLCRIYLAADGIRRVMPATFQYHELREDTDVDRLDAYVERSRDLQVGSGHPQGGNPLGSDPKRAVADERFRVHGLDNVFVCDASVFPTSTTVNPQLTVMALAQYAAPRIAEASA